MADALVALASTQSPLPIRISCSMRSAASAAAAMTKDSSATLTLSRMFAIGLSAQVLSVWRAPKVSDSRRLRAEVLTREAALHAAREVARPEPGK
ncbi:hypothetical protein ACWAUC_11195 [Bradyrhizobium guangdongense]